MTPDLNSRTREAAQIIGSNIWAEGDAPDGPCAELLEIHAAMLAELIEVVKRKEQGEADPQGDSLGWLDEDPVEERMVA